MIQKKRHITAGKYHLLGLITVVGVLSALWCQSFVSLADSTGTVTVQSAMIREKADANSEAVGSAASGNTVTIKDEVQDSSGTLWYEVYIDGDRTGYIRADLIEKQGGDGDTGTSQTQSGAPGASVDPGTVMDPQYATVSAATINVRKAPSANDGVVEQLARDTQVIVSGQSDGSDGKVWYYVTFTGSDGTEKSGFIRSDLLSLGDMVPVPEEEIPEPQETEPEPEVPVNDDYALKYESSADGTSEWYLYDYTGGKSDRYLLDQLMEATKVRSENDAADAKTLVRQRIVIVVLIVLLVLLVVAVVIMALKLRDVYYEDYEDEEEEGEDEEPPTQRKRRAEEEDTSSQRRRRAEEDTPSQRRRRTEEGEASSQRRRRTEEEESPSQRRRRTEEDSSARRRRRMEEDDDAGSAPAAPKRKSKNFLLDDEEFEFEFLNMDDRDL